MAAEETVSESDVTTVYSGPLEGFIGRRDALAKELRAAGRREAAAAARSLRKPSRTAWALDQAVLHAGGAIDALVAAVSATLEAQTAGGDVRAAITALRSAVRDFAAHAARAAEQAGHRIETSALATAVLAVLGQPDSFSALRRGALVDVPEAGGLDFLAGLPMPTQPAPRPTPVTSPQATAAPAAETEAVAARDAARQAEIAAAREAARDADVAFNTARQNLEAAQRTLRDADAEVAAEEERLRQAEAAARAARERREAARRETDAATARASEAERKLASAMRQLERLGVDEF